jgi:hypothetical protein
MSLKRENNHLPLQAGDSTDDDFAHSDFGLTDEAATA